MPNEVFKKERILEDLKTGIQEDSEVACTGGPGQARGQGLLSEHRFLTTSCLVPLDQLLQFGRHLLSISASHPIYMDYTVKMVEFVLD
mmetsp:Transcript_80279/g.141698  ORF Transcript_80279/g.141698 Transcript_80279/m.141698 type:complete len:88 (-) Transcript_80279:59-322(-)